MKVEQFLKYYFTKMSMMNREIKAYPCISTGNSELDNWKFRFILAENTSRLDYKCNFKAKGCYQYKNMIAPRCCCESCWREKGYIQELPNDLTIIEEIASIFTKDDYMGFWRPDGCALPRKYRSAICLSHHCGPMSKRDKFLSSLPGKSNYILYREAREEILKRFDRAVWRRPWDWGASYSDDVKTIWRISNNVFKTLTPHQLKSI